MKLKEFDYDLPESLIAQSPAPERTGSRLMLLDKKKQTIKHDKFPGLLEYLRPGDLLVFNDTRVIPARLFGHKEGTGGNIEILLIHPTSHSSWIVMAKPGRRIQPGHNLIFGENELVARVIKIFKDGTRELEFTNPDYMDKIFKIGQIPLPPYIKSRIEDPARYQTVFARHKGSSAAPTAALHFDEEMLNQLEKRKIEKAFVTLHIGPGTFRPVQASNIKEHIMHKEFFKVEQAEVEKIQKAKKENRRVIAVGTTAVRTLETVFDKDNNVLRSQGWTEIFIYPGYEFKIIDGLITNFHLPRSTLLMLVCAFAGREFVLSAYREAREKEYRFFSFGDSMFIF
ncbi:MAG: tRNA preQ1(34) S-adenosylmethionine ribosyltransferase-isomerase QueA [Vulcanimicrobiota bacterium]